MMLPLFLLELILRAGFTALLMSTNIAAGLYVRCVVSC
jgi:hypothetical protein